MAQLATDELESLETRIAGLAEKVAAAMGMEVVLIEIKGGGGRSLVRAYIDQPGGISLDDCERFSKRLSVLLDVEDWIPFSYTLEVSSPGLDRPLTRERDFERFRGKQAKIKTRAPIEGQRNFRGRILGVLDGRVGLDVDGGREVRIPLAEIERANLVVDI